MLPIKLNTYLDRLNFACISIVKFNKRRTLAVGKKLGWVFSVLCVIGL